MIDKLFEKAKLKNIEEMEAYIVKDESLSIRIYENDVDSYKLSADYGISFRGKYNGKMGYAYSEILDEKSIDILVDSVIENATIIDNEDEDIIFEGSKSYADVNTFNPDFDKVDEKDKLEKVMNLEKKAKSLDERVKSCNFCLYSDSFGERRIVNSKGLDINEKSNISYMYLSVVARDNEETRTGGYFLADNDFDGLDIDLIAKEAVNEAVSMFGAESIESGKYKVVFRNTCFASLLEAFTGVFSAENVQKNMSKLKGKLNQKVACDKFTLIDDPHYKKGLSTKAFDSEGVSTYKKNVIENGILKTYLYNLTTAKKDNVHSTGNGNRASFKSPVGIAPSNMYIEPGDVSFDEMIKDIKKGIVIKDLQGLHSGLNTISGDFSLPCTGYMIEEGKVTGPLDQMVVSGNYFDIINNIEMVSDDLKFTIPSGLGYIGSPSVLLNDISIAGK